MLDVKGVNTQPKSTRGWIIPVTPPHSASCFSESLTGTLFFPFALNCPCFGQQSVSTATQGPGSCLCFLLKTKAL